LRGGRWMLASAGTECRIRAPAAYSLSPAVDALLAWTVREGATNIVRHAAAGHAEIVIELTDTTASACLSDDGAGPGKASLPGMGGASPGAVPGGAAPRGAGGATAPDAGAGRTAGTGAGPGLTGPGLAAPVAGPELAAPVAGPELAAPVAGPELAAPVAGPELAAPVAGSGRAGLAGRAARLGGTLSAGAGEHGGFWLRVSVPLAGPAAPAEAGREPGRERMPS